MHKLLRGEPKTISNVFSPFTESTATSRGGYIDTEHRRIRRSFSIGMETAIIQQVLLNIENHRGRKLPWKLLETQHNFRISKSTRGSIEDIVHTAKASSTALTVLLATLLIASIGAISSRP